MKWKKKKYNNEVQEKNIYKRKKLVIMKSVRD